MRNLRKLKFEIKILDRCYGRNNIAFSSTGDWVKINNFRLPTGKYNISRATVLIIIPKYYDDESVSECYIDKDLSFRNGRALPHTYEKGLMSRTSREGYQWLCFEPPSRGKSGLLEFVNTLRFYLSDPAQYIQLLRRR